MSTEVQPTRRVAIACGGTGGHLFPGLAVANRLRERGCVVTLLISTKEVDQTAVKGVTGMAVLALPAIGLTRGKRLAFVRACWRSYRMARARFKIERPEAVLAMGGFTAAAPLLAGKRAGAATFLHESNTIPGRANRWLARFVTAAFVGFPSAAGRLRAPTVTVTGTPVRPEFQPRDAGACRRALGLDPHAPTILVMGGSQGAQGINALVQRSLPSLAGIGPEWQWLHLTGPTEVAAVKAAYAEARLRALVRPFLSEMELALGAATAAVSRAGASSLAELATVGVPAVLVPYPAATDNHQYYNACAFVESGAAVLLEQQSATPEDLGAHLKRLVQDSATRVQMQAALTRWHSPDAAERIASNMLSAISAPGCVSAKFPSSHFSAICST